MLSTLQELPLGSMLDEPSTVAIVQSVCFLLDALRALNRVQGRVEQTLDGQVE